MLSTIDHIFFVGIKGVAMANLARILKQMGKTVSGSDVSEEFITDVSLKEAEISVTTSFEASQLPADTQYVIYSASHGGKNNPQVTEGVKRGITVLHQADLLGMLIKEFRKSIAVAGCHGKTTTSGMLAYALSKLSHSSSHMIGVSSFGDTYGGEFKGKDYFVFEADEYGIDPPEDITPKFHKVNPDYALVTNLDFDHPDIYKSFTEVKDAFSAFMQKIIQKDTIPPVLFLNGDDEGLRDISFHLPPSAYIFYGASEMCDVTYSDISNDEKETIFVLNSEQYDIKHTEISVSLFGEKNVSNTTGVIAILLHLGFPIQDIKAVIRDYQGPKRRFEQKYFKNDIYVFDDYAHHPAEIDATITACQSRFPNRRMIVIFQPHTFTRTKQFADAFAEVLSRADEALLLPIFSSARENAEGQHITSDDLVDLARKKGITTIKAFGSKEDLTEYLSGHISQGDIIFTMGAGDVYKLDGEIEKIIDRM